MIHGCAGPAFVVAVPTDIGFVTAPGLTIFSLELAQLDSDLQGQKRRCLRMGLTAETVADFSVPFQLQEHSGHEYSCSASTYMQNRMPAIVDSSMPRSLVCHGQDGPIRFPRPQLVDPRAPSRIKHRSVYIGLGNAPVDFQAHKPAPDLFFYGEGGDTAP